MGVKGCMAGVIGAVVANQLSEASDQDSAEPLNPVIHKLLHGGLGAGTGAIIDGERGAKAGAIGAFVAETVANLLTEDRGAIYQRVQEKAEAQGVDPTDTDRLSGFIMDEVSSTLYIARLSGAIAALLTHQDVSAAEVAATNAVENNFLPGVVAGGLMAYKLYKAYRTVEKIGKGAAVLRKAASATDKALKAARAIDKATSSTGGGAPDPDPDDHDQKQFSKETKEILGETNGYKEQLLERAGKSKDQTTLNAAQKELKGEQIPLAQERGRAYDHITKVERAQEGLLNLIGRINRRLGFPGLPLVERQALQQELSKASRLLDHTQSFVPRS
jgi:uncharacterized membrane protein YeaQ/YmgE (transglycosylase-associated protein family)